jgi:hypothetical protein
MTFVLIGEHVINTDLIERIDFSNIEDLRLTVYFKNSKPTVVIGIQTIDILMAIKPSAFESRRMRWYRHVWMFHNLVGHPLMQMLAFLKQYKLAMRVHDLTIPRPLGRNLKWDAERKATTPRH